MLAGSCSRRSWCLLEPVLPEPGLKPKEEPSGVVKALVQSKCAKVGLGGGGGREERLFRNSAF